MSDFILLLLIFVLLLCLLVTVGGLLVYSGLLSDVVVKTGPPPVPSVTIAYKFKRGSYKDSGAGYTESCSIGPKLKSIGIFYDDPKEVRAHHSAAGLKLVSFFFFFFFLWLHRSCWSVHTRLLTTTCPVCPDELQVNGTGSA